jgi:hypothetical protein
MMNRARPASFPRRELLTGVVAFGSLGALATLTLPNIPALVRDALAPLPAWAAATPRSARAYHAAMRRADLLAQLPCYCGCMTSAPLAHQNLHACYFLADGSFNTHAAGCGICQSEALDADRLLLAGRSRVDVRQEIDDTYGSASCTADRCVD